jgi:hypothetical protein
VHAPCVRFCASQIPSGHCRSRFPSPVLGNVSRLRSAPSSILSTAHSHPTLRCSAFFPFTPLPYSEPFPIFVLPRPAASTIPPGPGTIRGPNATSNLEFRSRLGVSISRVIAKGTIVVYTHPSCSHGEGEETICSFFDLPELKDPPLRCAQHLFDPSRPIPVRTSFRKLLPRGDRVCYQSHQQDWFRGRCLQWAGQTK